MKAKRLLMENREALDKIAAFLIEKETITGKEFMKIFHEVKGVSEGEVKKEERIAMKPVEFPDHPEIEEAVQAPEETANEEESTGFGATEE